MSSKFTFTDRQGREYGVRTHEGKPWLFMRVGKVWTLVRPLKPEDVQSYMKYSGTTDFKL